MTRRNELRGRRWGFGNWCCYGPGEEAWCVVIARAWIRRTCAPGWNVTSIMRWHAIGRVLTPLLLLDSSPVSKQVRIAPDDWPLGSYYHDFLSALTGRNRPILSIRCPGREKNRRPVARGRRGRRGRNAWHRWGPSAVVWINKFSALSSRTACNELVGRSFWSSRRGTIERFFFIALCFFETVHADKTIIKLTLREKNRTRYVINLACTILLMA